MCVCPCVTLLFFCHPPLEEEGGKKYGCLRRRQLHSLKLSDVNLPVVMDFYDEETDFPLRVEGWLNVWGKFSLIFLFRQSCRLLAVSSALSS